MLLIVQIFSWIFSQGFSVSFFTFIVEEALINLEFIFTQWYVWIQFYFLPRGCLGVSASCISLFCFIFKFLPLTFFFFFFASLVAQMVKNLQWGRPGFDPWVGKIPWKRAWKPTPVFLPGESPWTEEPGGLQSMGSQRVKYNWAIKPSPYFYLPRRKVSCFYS